MSVSGRGFKSKVVGGGEVMGDNPEKTHNKECCADNDVGSVESCCNKEGRAIDAIGDGEWGNFVFS